MDNPCVWLPEPSWDNVSELDKLTNFHGIVMSFEQYSRDWNIWYTSAEPETSVIPGPFSQQLFYTANYREITLLRVQILAKAKFAPLVN